MSYLCVKDPKLAEHLAWWGIDIMKLEKTDKTMAELEVRTSFFCLFSRHVLDAADLLHHRYGACYRIHTSLILAHRFAIKWNWSCQEELNA